jgi:hypothetical protein
MAYLFFRFARVWALLLCPLPVWAHEFWIAPVTTPLAAGGTANISLLVGEYFTGELVGFSKAQTASFRQYSAAGHKDLAYMLPAVAVAALPVPIDKPGTHLIAFDSQPHVITLSADAFHAYLHDEGLDFIKTRREAAGTAQLPGRERYRRFVKALLQAGKADGSGSAKANANANANANGGADKTFSTLTGQRLELVPLANPLRLRPGNALGLRVLFEGQPLAGALLKAWHKQGSQTLVIRATTAADGSAVFNLPYAGPWMVSVVHMIPAADSKDIDWDSLWGSLSFVMPQ